MKTNLSCAELKCGMVVCEQNPDGTLLQQPYNQMHVISSENGVVHFARPIVIRMEKGKGNLADFRRMYHRADILNVTDNHIFVGAIQTFDVQIEDDSNMYTCVHDPNDP